MHPVDFKRYSQRNVNVFEENKFVKPGAGRVSTLMPNAKFYDNALTKDKVLKSHNKFLTKFDQQVARPSQVIQHDYPFDTVDTDPNSNKRKWTQKRTSQPISLDKIKGREDNFMYKVSEGYNL